MHLWYYSLPFSRMFNFTSTKLLFTPSNIHSFTPFVHISPFYLCLSFTHHPIKRTILSKYKITIISTRNRDLTLVIVNVALRFKKFIFKFSNLSVNFLTDLLLKQSRTYSEYSEQHKPLNSKPHVHTPWIVNISSPKSKFRILSRPSQLNYCLFVGYRMKFVYQRKYTKGDKNLNSKLNTRVQF